MPIILTKFSPVAMPTGDMRLNGEKPFSCLCSISLCFDNSYVLFSLAYDFQTQCHFFTTNFCMLQAKQPSTAEPSESKQFEKPKLLLGWRWEHQLFMSVLVD